MVRTDHEDGEVLKPESDGVAKKTAGTVRKSSPVSRRRKSSGKAAPAVPEETTDLVEPSGDDDVSDQVSDDDVVADDAAAEVVEKPSLEKAGPDTSEDPASDEDGDDAAFTPAQGVSYRARRASTKSSVAAPSIKGGWLPAIGMAVAAVLVVVSIVLTAVFLNESSKINDQRELRASYDQFAQEVIVKMTTLTKDNADEMLQFMKDNTSGRAQQQFRESMKQATDLIREDNMKTTTTIVASAVEKADQDSGSVLVVFVWEGTAPEAPEKPEMQSFRSRVSITRINDALKMTNIEWVN
ncbi:Mce-associated membrane protein [Gordonia malaquae]|uniref:Mce-associated membrane protein n=1 Tax=Gordonia malaquae NBRC 108250 TaxID=1223542 RepID=M3UUJ7_GORML|nr:hypothetical protein [Gordonia malaquae]GAC79117.1 hypothetical protein GM1_007_00760 [Gordonia malaquae NBRC 108250]SEE09270.1 Mce-associated membrane protein [Gordonia malaquae]